MVFGNKDLPGVIGEIGTTLAKNGINIARFSLGREAGVVPAGAPPRNALAIVQTDTEVTETVLAQLRASHAVVSVKSVSL